MTHCVVSLEHQAHNLIVVGQARVAMVHMLHTGRNSDMVRKALVVVHMDNMRP